MTEHMIKEQEVTSVRPQENPVCGTGTFTVSNLKWHFLTPLMSLPLSVSHLADLVLQVLSADVRQTVV